MESANGGQGRPPSCAGPVDLEAFQSTTGHQPPLEDTAMQYMLLIYNNEEQKLSPAEQGQLMQEYMTFTQDIVKSGKFKAGDPLEPTSTATTVRVRNSKTLATDGPFAETKEQLGGYYLVEAKDLDEAVAIAARIPTARTGSIEVRPIRKIEM
jgi:hypothetical protein